MASSADDKRWAILPPPSPESSAISGEFHVDAHTPIPGKAAESQTGVRTRPPKRSSSGPAKRPSRAVSESSVQALEPADSQLITERPPADELPSRAEGPETVPAPSWADELDG